MAVDDYITLDVDTEPDDLALLAYEYMQSVVPGWDPAIADTEVWLIEALARIASDIRDATGAVPPAIFRAFGSLAGIPPIEAVAAEAVVTITVVDTVGYTIPVDTQIGIRDDAGTLHAFTTVDEVVVDPGDTTVTDVALVAALEGADPNGANTSAEMIDALAYVASVTVTTAPVDGTDAESNEEFLNRLSSELRLLAPRPILPDDFAVLARRIDGIERATAIDLYNPGDDTYDNERTVTVAVHGPAGVAASSGSKLAVDALLQSMREVNFVVHVMDPTYATIDVTFEIIVADGWNEADTVTRSEAAIAEALDPARWGSGETGTGESPTWENTVIVRRLDLVGALYAVDGVAHVTALTLAENPDALGTADVTMTGAAALPLPGTIIGAVA